MMTKNKNWTEEEDRQLYKLLSQGATNREIAKVLDRTERAVDLRRYKLGYSQKNFFTERLLERAKKYEQELGLLRPRR